MSFDECPICYDEMNESNTIKTDCNHKYHKDCLNAWTEKHNSCPICRKKIRNSYILDDYEFLQELEDEEHNLRMQRLSQILFQEHIRMQRLSRRRQIRIRKYILTRHEQQPSAQIYENIW